MTIPTLRKLLQSPLARGILANSITWPSACLVQQAISGETFETYDWKRCGRYFIYGTCVTAPMFYGWVRISSRIWPETNIRSAIKKVLLEQISYGPLAGCSFFYGMTLLETHNSQMAVEEVKEKFFPAYKIAICYWPLIQTINFGLLAEKNRVVFVAICSFCYTIFLAYFKQLDNAINDKEEESEQQQQQQQQNLSVPKELKLQIEKKESVL